MKVKKTELFAGNDGLIPSNAENFLSRPQVKLLSFITKK